MIADAQFAAEMDYCGPLGIAWDEFLSWPRRSRDAAIIWTQRKRQACPSCGTRPEEWDPDRGGSDVAYAAEVRSCRGCETRASAESQLPKDTPGAHIVLVPHQEGL